MNPTYAICITHRNNVATVRKSLESILTQIDDKFEVVVVDSFSNDGSFEVLQKFHDEGAIRLMRRKCSRGLGRQIAFENSKGEYVIANMDLDDTFRPVLSKTLDFYLAKTKGKVLRVTDAMKGSDVPWHRQAVTIAPRGVVSSVGGWRDLNWGEDWDLWERAARVGVYRWTVIPFRSEVGSARKTAEAGFVGRNIHRFRRNRQLIRLGRPRYTERTLMRVLADSAARLSMVGSDKFPTDQVRWRFDEKSPETMEPPPVGGL